MRQLVGTISVLLLTLIVSDTAWAQGTLWQTYQGAGEKALNDGKLEEAERLIRAAMAEAAPFGANDPYRRQARSRITRQQGQGNTPEARGV
jgi:hypothetical protein